ncbi:MAG: MBL fold metallo-hydrolase, partial [Clostridia bacterium]
MAARWEGGQSDQASLQSEEDLTAYFLDVGQADSTLLVSQGEAVLIDAGNRDDAEFILGYIKNLGIDHLKYVIFTHPHEDHIGSGRNVLQQFGADTVYM